jgi:acyl dehydratase|tara:strand:+ start:2474 stop:2935 length:462 start_codon:yes stop_codon:yes gene_type:complete
MQFGRYLEEFNEGDIYKHWPGRTITESDNVLFCMLTMNHHPLHIDKNYAEGTQFKQNVVVGNLVMDIAFGMSVEDVSGKAIANLSIDKIKFHKPTFHGDTIYAETEVLSVRESEGRKDRGIVTVETRATNQREEMVMSFTRSVLIPKMEADSN